MVGDTAAVIVELVCEDTVLRGAEPSFKRNDAISVGLGACLRRGGNAFKAKGGRVRSGIGQLMSGSIVRGNLSNAFHDGVSSRITNVMTSGGSLGSIVPKERR